MRRRFALLTLVLSGLVVHCGCAASPPSAGVVSPGGAARPGDVIDDRDGINAAIAEAASRGGGVVALGPGVWRSDGPIRLLGGVELRVERGATLVFGDDRADYPPVERRIEGIELWGPSPLIYAADARDVSLTGGGTIDGSGGRWWRRHLERPRDAPPTSALERVYAELNAGRDDRNAMWFAARPVLVGFDRCERVRVEGVTLRDSPFWTLHPAYCEDVTIRGVRVVAPADSPNTDGINPDSSRRVLIENCTLDTGDDGIAIKSGYNEDGRRIDRPAEDITVRGCVFVNGRSAVAIGSETSGSVRRVLVEDCRFEGTLRGLRIKTARGRGGFIEDITVRRCVATGIPRAALQIDMHYAGPPPEPVSERTPRLGRVLLEDIEIDGAGRAIELRGLPELPGGPVVIRRVEARGAAEPVLIEHIAVRLDGVSLGTRPPPSP